MACLGSERWSGRCPPGRKRAAAKRGAQPGRPPLRAAARLDRDLLEANSGARAPDLADDLVTPPGFDEYLLGDKDRDLMVAPEHKQAIIPGGNGVFRPTLVRSGRVIGTWTRTTGRRRTVVNLTPLLPLAATERARVEAAFGPYARYLGQPVKPRWPNAK